MYVISLLSPVAMFLAYFFNACIAHNLYITFYAYKNTFNKRIYVYKIGALVGAIIVFIISILLNNRVSDKNEYFTVRYYPFYFIAGLYFVGGIIMVYMIFKTLYVIRKKEEFMSLLNRDENSSSEDVRRNILYLFIKRHILFLILFIICYAPNNVVLLVQFFTPYKICFDCNYFSIFVYAMSLSCTFSFVLKLTEPYMQKYIKLIINFILRKQMQIDETTKDYSSIYNENNDDSLVQNGEQSEPRELEDLEKTQRKISAMNEMADTYANLNKEMSCNDFFARLIALNIAISEDNQYEFDPEIEKMFKAFLPWSDEKYTQKSEFKDYTDRDIPDWLNINEISNQL
jgi:hypothetical protein